MRKVIEGVNDLATLNPELSKEWDYEKNKPLTPNMVSIGSSKKVWWRCSLGHSWNAVIHSRASGKKGCSVCAGQKVEAGFNDLATKFPKIIEQWDYEKNGSLKPNQILSKTKRVVWWRCNKGHSYEMSVDKKTSRSFGCPICSNYRIVKGINDLATKDPKLALEWHPYKNGELSPFDIGINSTKKIWWICQKGHEWQARPHDRANDRTGCPICSARRSTSFPEQAIFYYIKKLFPDCINRYKDIFDNGMELDVYIPRIMMGIEFDGRVYHRSKEQHERELIKYHLCQKHDINLVRIKEHSKNEWKDTADSVYFVPHDQNYKTLGRLIQHILDYLDTEAQLKRIFEPKTGIEALLPQHSSVDVNIERDRLEILSYLTDINNSLSNIRPDLAEQWDYEKNKPLTPEMFSPGSNEKVWWICTKCGNSYKTTINKKNRFDTRLCPTCARIRSGKSFTQFKVKQVGSLRETNPELLSEFHPTKNRDITPDNITAGRFKKVWWLCSKCGFEWQQSPNNRKKGIGCPHCSGRVPMTGVDDLLTVNPSLCKEWNYSKNILQPSQVLPGSGKKVWWICAKCGHEWQATINSRKKHGCPKCNHKRKK